VRGLIGAVVLAMAVGVPGAGVAGEPAGYLALGDSYTIGEAVPETGRWPVQLAALLAARGEDTGPVRIIARTGWTTDELSAALDDAELDAPYARVSLLIGVNNQYRGRALAEYEREFGALLDRAIGYAGGDGSRVFVVSIPDWGVTPFAAKSGRDVAAIGREIDAFNAAAATIARARGVRVVDVTDISRRPDPDGTLLAEDGLHPSAAQYALWAERIADALAR
jgi:lysophospholipase L1-like esterase